MDLGWRYGSLPQDVVDELAAQLDLSNLGNLQDCLPDTGLFDVGPWVVSSAQSSASCVSPGRKLSNALTIIQSRAAVLWSNAQRMSSAIRFSAVVAADDSSTVYTWPIAAPLAAFVFPEDVPLNAYKGYSVGVSNLVSDGADASRLRALREQYVADRTATPASFTDGQRMSDGTTTAFVYMRDSLPYEDEHGLWPF
jgi:hypothetical protein